MARHVSLNLNKNYNKFTCICHVAKVYSQLPDFVYRGQIQRVSILQWASCTKKFYRGKSKTRLYYKGVSVILPFILWHLFSVRYGLIWIKKIDPYIIYIVVGTKYYFDPPIQVPEIIKEWFLSVCYLNKAS
jgi:hypothetical protein